MQVVAVFAVVVIATVDVLVSAAVVINFLNS